MTGPEPEVFGGRALTRVVDPGAVLVAMPVGELIAAVEVERATAR